jgi:hypothetical protein
METNKPSEQTTAPITIPLGILDVRLASQLDARRTEAVAKMRGAGTR